MTLSVIKIQRPGPLTPYGGKCPGPVFPTPYKRTESKKDCLGTSVLVDCFIYTRVVVTRLPRGGSGPSSRQVQGREWNEV